MHWKPRRLNDYGKGYSAWIGSENRQSAVLQPERAKARCATLNLRESSALPLGNHWCLGLDGVATANWATMVNQ